MAGLELDPWQELVLEGMLGERADGSWAAFEVGLMVSRQNGKGAILEARELAGLFLLGERLIIHSAHEFPTSLEAFRRLKDLIQNTPALDRRVRRYTHSHGEEGIELKSGQRIRFRTRTKGGGRGFSCDCLIFDEAMILPETAQGAVLPTLSARPNPQVLYTGSAVDQEVHEHGVVFARVRERGLKGDPRLAYFDWSLDFDVPEAVPESVVTDPAAWAEANPGLGIRVSAEIVALEQRSLSARTFAVERLGVGDWPRTDEVGQRKIAPDAWAKLKDEHSRPRDPVAFAFDVTPDRSSASIGAAGARRDGLAHVEIVERKRGTGWIVDRVVGLVGSHVNVGVICDARGPAGSLVPALEARGVKVIPVSAGEHAQACGMFFDGVDQREVRHLGTQEMTTAIGGAMSRPLGDAWAWSRKDSTIDISPLVAVTLAHWGLKTIAPRKKAVAQVY
jgi:hypothetical protein